MCYMLQRFCLTKLHLSPFPVLQPQMQSIMTSPQLQPVTIQHQRVLTPTGQTIQTLSTAPTVHTVQQQVQQVPVTYLTGSSRPGTGSALQS